LIRTMFNKDTWQEQIQHHLGGLKRGLARRAQQQSPYLVYGTLLGTPLWPAVAAAAQTGQWTAVITALTGIAGGVGADLLAGQITAWKDRAGPVKQAEIAEWVSHHAADQGEQDYR